MKEKELQEQISASINNSGILNLITNRTMIQAAYDKYFNGPFYPNFSVDYLLYKNYYEGAMSALRLISGDLDMINGADIRNISLEKNERLFPDYLFFNKETGAFIIAELKKEKAAARETITELLAYKTELQNHIPFYGDNNIVFVIIATEFSVLLNHSASNLLLQHQPILCLKPNIVNDKFIDFEIYQPIAWTNINQPNLREDQFQGAVFSISAKPEMSFTDEMFLSKLHIALEYLKQAGEQSRTTGFSFVCLPNKIQKLSNIISADAFIYFFILNPYSLLKNSVGSDLLSEYIKQNIVEESFDRWLPSCYYDIPAKMVQILETDFNVYYENESSFSEFRCNNGNNFVPILCTQWGELSNHLMFTYAHPIAGKRFKKPSCDLSVPAVFFNLYDFATSNYPFAAGFDKMGDYFEFGVKIGSALSLFENCKEDSLKNYFGAIAILRLNDLSNSINDINEYFLDFKIDRSITVSNNLKKDQIENIINYLEELIYEFERVLERNPSDDADIFIAGVKHYALFDEYFSSLPVKQDEQWTEMWDISPGQDELINLYYYRIVEIVKEQTAIHNAVIQAALGELAKVYNYRNYVSNDLNSQIEFLSFLKTHFVLDGSKLNSFIDRVNLLSKCERRKFLRSYRHLISSKASHITPSEVMGIDSLNTICDMQFLLKALKDHENAGKCCALRIGDSGTVDIVELVPNTQEYRAYSFKEKDKIAVWYEAGGMSILKFENEYELLKGKVANSP